jgi:sugar fermentation stimulation protein A
VSPRLVGATFHERPNRFIVVARLEDGRSVRAHLGDPGRLKELLLPGARLRLKPVAPGVERKTRFTVALVQSPDLPRVWVSLETARANRLAEPLLAEGTVRGIPRPLSLRREVTRGASRFDFQLLGRAGVPTWVEVKSVTLVEEGVAFFPDAPTTRGVRHLRELAAMAKSGEKTAVLFVVQRHDAREVRANERTDPDFAQALADAREAGVRIRAVAFRLTPGGGARFNSHLPVRI